MEEVVGSCGTYVVCMCCVDGALECWMYVACVGVDVYGVDVYGVDVYGGRVWCESSASVGRVVGEWMVGEWLEEDIQGRRHR